MWEARMASAEDCINRYKELAGQGWERRFTVEAPRANEMKTLYESMGFEVLVEPGWPDEGQECGECFAFEDFQSRYKTLFTRRHRHCDRSRQDEPFD